MGRGTAGPEKELQSVEHGKGSLGYFKSLLFLTLLL